MITKEQEMSSRKFDHQDEIKCWNRKARKRFDFRYEVNPVTEQVSPRNTSLSCISALTFDDSMNLINDHASFPSNDQNSKDVGNEDPADTFLISRQRDELQSWTIDNKSSSIGRIEQKSFSQQDVGFKGSLYSRITNGYIGNLQDEGKKEDTAPRSSTPPLTVSNNDIDEEMVDIGSGEYDEYENDETTKVIDLIIEEDESYRVATVDSPSEKSMQGNESGRVNDTMSDLNDQPCEPLENMRDQWREVNDDETGKTYFYNRRTRESRWTLPPDAILLSKKRKINEKAFTESIDSPKNVSIASSDVNEKIEDKQNQTPEEQKIPIASQKSLDGYNSTFDNDEEKSHTIVERCRRVQKSQRSKQRRKFFFPDACEDFNDEEVEESTEQSSVQDDEKTSFTEEANFAYCMFCGIETHSNHHLVEHLNAGCPAFKTSEKKDEICDLINNTISRVESLILRSNNDYEINQYIAYEEENKENIPNISQHVEEEISNNQTLFTNSDDEETIADCSFNRHHFGRSSNRHYIEEEASPILSTCPFCERSFQGGSYLSKHLLKCNARRKSNKKRAMRNSFTEQDESRRRRKSSANIQSLLLTDGGRCLPGYPKVEKNTTHAFDLGRTI